MYWMNSSRLHILCTLYSVHYSYSYRLPCIISLFLSGAAYNFHCVIYDAVTFFFLFFFFVKFVSSLELQSHRMQHNPKSASVVLSLSIWLPFERILLCTQECFKRNLMSNTCKSYLRTPLTISAVCRCHTPYTVSSMVRAISKRMAADVLYVCNTRIMKCNNKYVIKVVFCWNLFAKLWELNRYTLPQRLAVFKLN